MTVDDRPVQLTATEYGLLYVLSPPHPASRKACTPHLAFRVLVEAAHPDLADAVTVHPICQEELCNPGREVSINPNENSILTP